MKESFGVEDDSLTFIEALKNIKSPSSTTLNSSRSCRQNGINRLSQISQINNFMSPTAKLIKRTNTTLRNLLNQYETCKQNQYILRLQIAPSSRNNGELFEDWLNNFYAQSQKYDTNRRKQNMQSKAMDSFKQIQIYLPNHHKKYTHKNLFTQKMTEKTNIESDVESNKQKCLNISKCSFSVYFQNCQNDQLSLVDQKSKNDYNFNKENNQKEDQVIQQKFNENQNKNQFSLIQDYQVPETSCLNKENTDPNIKEQFIQIKGLQFSKNKRFKTTKKKRKTK